MTGVLIKGDLDIDTHRDKTGWRYREKTANHTPSKEAWDKPSLPAPRTNSADTWLSDV